jgi:hypothetical protein
VSRHKPLLLAVGSVPIFAACSFLLDFNNLQGGRSATADAGPDGNTAGTGGTSDASSAGASNLGEGGASGACDAAACDDGDPCTTDSCDATATDGCAHVFTPGLGLEQDFTPILADSQVRVTMTAGSDAFYFSNLSVTGKLSEVELFRLGENDDAYTSLKKLSTFATFTGAPVSAAGLAVDTSGAIGETLHGLVAVKDTAGDAQVWQIVADAKQQFGIPTKVGDSYDASLALNYPVARALNGVVHGAWINADGTISVLSPGDSSPQKFGGGGPLTAGVLTLIGTDTYQPAVVYSGKTNGVYLETAGSNRTAMPECQTAAGGYLSMSSTALAGHNGIWFADWTKYTSGTNGTLTNEAHLIVCTNGACLPDTTTKCKPGDENNLQRDVALESVHLPGDPAEQTYAISVVPVVTPDVDAGTTNASLVAFLARLNSPLDKTGTSTPIGTALTVASQVTTSDAFRGPDFPAVAVIPGQQVKVALAWIQPPATGTGSDELRVQRYRMCLAQ